MHVGQNQMFNAVFWDLIAYSYIKISAEMDGFTFRFLRTSGTSHL
jgi:hypothetical protein